MQIDVMYRPAHSLARVSLPPGESIVAESGAMVGMSSNVQMQTQSQGGMMGGLKRMFGGESFFRNTFTAQGGPGEVLLAHSLCGDMVVLEMTQLGLLRAERVLHRLDAERQHRDQGRRLSLIFRGRGRVRAQGHRAGPGQMLVGAFGGMEELDCDGNMVIDTGHLVAWDASLTYSVGKSGSGWIASFLSGEGLVCHFTGQGRIWIQSRNPTAYGQAVGRLLPPRSG